MKNVTRCLLSLTSFVQGTDRRNIRKIASFRSILILLILLVSIGERATAQRAMSLYNTFSGLDNYTMMGGSIRCCQNSGDACGVVASSACPLTIPSGANVVGAYLYWSGSYLRPSVPPDWNVTLTGPDASINNITASRTDTVIFVNSGTNYPFFAGFADITSYISSKGSGMYTFSNLSVNATTPHCGNQTVLGGWAVVVVYSLGTLTKHTINIYDGFNYVYGSSVTFTPSNFFVPYGTKEGKMTHITWEGDSTNSGTNGGFSEQLKINGTVLTDGLNPASNQFNSVSSGLPSGYQRTFGVDIDTYDITPYLTSAETTATSVYSSGADLVLLNCEIISIIDTTNADVSVNKTHSGGATLIAGAVVDYTVTPYNNGPDSCALTIRDTMPAAMRISSIDVSNYWTIDSSGKPAYEFSHPSFKVPPIGALPQIIFHTLVTDQGYPVNPVNYARAISPYFDRHGGNDIAKDSFGVNTPVFRTSTKTAVETHPGRSVPGDSITYTITVKNTGNYVGNPTTVVDSLPLGVNLRAGSISGTPAITGTVSNRVITFSNFSIAAGGTQTITYKGIVDSNIVVPGLSWNKAHIRAYNVIDQAESASVTGWRPALWLRKSESPTHCTPGDTITYTIKFGNLGNDADPVDSLYDNIPSNTAFVPGSITLAGNAPAPTGMYDAGTNRIRVAKTGTVVGDTSNILTFKVRVNNPLTFGATMVTNSATLFGVKSPPMTVSVIDTVNATSTITIAESGPSTGLLLGGPPAADTVRYIIRDTVKGSATLDSVYLNDTIPSGMTVLSIGGSGSVAGGVAKWNLGTLSPGTVVVETLLVRTTTPGAYLDRTLVTYKQNVSGIISNTITTIIILPHTATLTQTTPISPGQPVIVTVSDVDLAGRGSISLTKTNPRTGETELDVLHETGLNSGIFKDTIQTVFGTSSNGNNNGSFAVQAGDSIVGTWVDSVNAAGVLQTLTAVTRVLGGHTAVLGVNPSVVLAGNTLAWTINDTDLNHNASVAETYSYLLVSSAGDTETVVFKETGANTGIFTDTIASVYRLTITKNDNLFELLPGQTISLIYRDSLTLIGSSVLDTIRAAVMPPPPVVVTPANGSIINTPTPNISGTAEANSKVRIYIDGALIDSVTANGSGAWTYTSAALSQGSHTVKATDVVAGITSGFSNINTFTIDSVPPPVPVVVTPLNGSVIATTTAAITGTAEANTKVRVYIDGVLKDSVIANGAGNWTYNSTALSQGSHNVKATSTDSVGNTSVFSNINTFTIDTVVPAAPVVSMPADGSFINTTTPAITGTAEANSKVRVYIDGVLKDSVTADGTGHWSYSSSALSAGSHSVKATSTDAAGNTSIFSNINSFTIDITPPAPPVVILPADGSTIATTTPTISGTADAGTKVRVYIDDVLKDSVMADGTGHWSYPSGVLSQGSHTAKATSTDAAGNTSVFSNTNTFTIDTVPPSPPVVVYPPDGASIPTQTPTFTGTAEPNSKVRIYIDNVLVDSVTANGAGNWTFTSSTLAFGSHDVKATSTDAGGNTSGISNIDNFTIDASYPDAPVVVMPANGSHLALTTPEIQGTATFGDSVKVYLDGLYIGNVFADPSGNWHLTSPVLSQGSHTVYATSTNTAGHVSVNSNTNTFIVDTVAPAVPIVVTPADGSHIATTTPTITGTAEANSKVRVYIDGVLVDSVTANGAGAWSYPSAALSQGIHTVKGTSTDAAGNTSVFSDTNTFTIDTVPPSPPVVVLPADGSHIPTATPTFTGSAEPNTKVRVYVDGILVDSVWADGAGAWSHPSAALSQGVHDVKVTSTDSAGNTSVLSNTNTFTIDTIAPAAPVVVLPADGSTIPTQTPTITGTAEANSKVRVYIDNILVDSVTADGSGHWSHLSASLAIGSHTVKATSTDSSGNTSVFSNTNTFTIDASTPDPPVVTVPVNGAVLATTTPTIHGTAPAHDTVKVYIDGVYIGEVLADGTGNWSIPSGPLSQGSHNVYSTATNAAGTTSVHSNQPAFTIDTVAPAAPVVIMPADGSILATTTPEINGTAEPYSKIRIYIDGVLADSLTADDFGGFSIISAALSEGSHNVKVTSTDDAGNTSVVSNTNTFIIDTIAPSAPVVVTPADGSHIATTTPVITGTSEPNSRVRVYIDGALIDSVMANGTGDWTYPTATPLSQGVHNVKATSTDAAGNTSVFSNTNVFTIDTIAPAPPVVILPADGSTIPTQTPTITGTAEANTKVRVYIDNVLVDSVHSDGAGNWSYPSSTLAIGSHAAKATSTDSTGNTSVFSNTNTFFIDTSMPAAPVIDQPANGSHAATTTPTIIGTAPAQDTVKVYIDGTYIGTTIADGAGNWSLPGGPLSQGSHTVYATATNAAGTTSPHSNMPDIIVDTVAPAPPVVVLPADGSIIATTTPVITGTAEANSKVRVYIDGALIDSVMANGTGAWSYPTVTPLSQGSHAAKATSTDAAGNTSVFSNINTFTIDSIAPSTPVVVTPTDGSILDTTTPAISGTAEPNSKVRVYIDGVLVDSIMANGAGAWMYPSAPLSQGVHTVKATSTDAAGNTSVFSNINTFTIDTIAPNPPVVVYPADGSHIPTTTPTITGTAEANTKVRVYIDGILVDSVMANGTGNWSYPSAALSQGSHTVRATSTDAAGNTSVFSNMNTFIIDTVAPAPPVVVLPADGSVIPTTTPTITGTAEPNSNVRVYLDNVLRDSIMADGSGHWSLTSPVLAIGSHSVKATSTDAAGNTSVFSNTNVFTIDTSIPAAPVITGPANGSVLDTTTPTLTGTAPANDTVKIYIDGVYAGSVVADGLGHWTAPSGPLAQGGHTVYVTATNIAGTTSPHSNQPDFTLDTVTPAAPVVLLPADGSVIATTTPVMSGTAEPNSTVRVYIDGVLIDSVTATGAGAWSYPSGALSQGLHTVKATSTDSAGNTSVFSNTNAFTIDTIAPIAPVVVTPLNGSFLPTSTPVINGTAEAGSKVRVYIDGALKDSVMADGTGHWSLTSPTLSPGVHDVKATSTDAAGNTSVFSNTNSFTIDLTTPAAPVITGPANGSILATTTPLITGTAPPNDTVKVYIDGALIGTIVADGTGHWSIPSDSLSQGSHSVYATATNQAGTTSPQSNTPAFSLDTVYPAAPIISGPINGSTISDQTPTITGVAEPGSKVRIYLDGALTDSVVCDSAGHWIYTSGLLSPGLHLVQATEIDSAGNISPFSTIDRFTIGNLPVLTQIIPPVKTTADTQFTMTLNGLHFVPGSIVQINGSNRVTTFISSTQLTAIIPTSDMAVAGVFSVAVMSPSLDGYITDSLSFRVNNLVPVITSLSPADTLFGGPGFTLTIDGANFLSTSVVSVDGVPRATTFINDHQVTIQILPGDIASIGTLDIRVTNPGPGGGTSVAAPFHVRGARIGGTVFYDADQSGTFDAGERGLTAWRVELAGTDPANNQWMLTQPGGTFLFWNLRPDTYTLTVVPRNALTPSCPPSSSFTIPITVGAAITDQDFGFYTLGGDTVRFRSFSVDSMATQKAVAKKSMGTEWEYTAVNTTGKPANRLRVIFGQNSVVVRTNDPFTEVEPPSRTDRTWRFGGGTIEDGESVFMEIFFKGKKVTVTRYDWYWDDKIIPFKYGRPDSAHMPVFIRSLYLMPNTANVRNEVFRQGGFRSTGGLIVGIPRPDQPKNFAWAILKLSTDVQRTLHDKTGYHTGLPRGFKPLNSPAEQMQGPYKTPLTPSWFNNHLYAEIVTLKINIAASRLGIAPVGFGELIYDDGSSTLSGKMIKEIAAVADTAMTYWKDKPKELYGELDAVIHNINSGLEGPLDTLSYVSMLRLTGASTLGPVSWMLPNPTVAPAVLPRVYTPEMVGEEEFDTSGVDSEPVNTATTGETPERYALYQNYPNPFNPVTTIDFDIPAQSMVSLKLYNILGQEVMTVLDGALLEVGSHSHILDASKLPSGVYLYRIMAEAVPNDAAKETVGKFNMVKKLLLVK